MSEFFFISGKGGVGKTSTAAALAFRFSKKGKTLLVSTDPAHSLRHIFKKKFKGRKEILENLWAEEIDPEKATNPLGENLFGIDLTGPGADEVVAFNQFLELLTTKDYEYIVFDTAPTGHTLRLLSLPKILDSWLVKIIQLKNKFGMLTSMFSKDEKGKDPFETMKQKIKKGKEQLKKSHFYAVLIPEKMSILETKEALTAMKKHGLKFEKIIVNKALNDCKCAYCKKKRKEEQQRLKEIKRGFKVPVSVVPMFETEIYGKNMLKEFSNFIKI